MKPTNPGEVAISVNGRSYLLESSLRAFRAVNAIGPGFTPVLQAVRNHDASTIAQVIMFGAGKTDAKEADGIEEAVFRGGIISLVDPVARYVIMLANGGKDPDADAGETAPDASGNGASA